MVSEKSNEKVVKPADSKDTSDKKVDPSKAKDSKLKPIEDEDLVKLKQIINIYIF